MIIRLRSRDGNFRHEFQPTSTIADLITKILEDSPDADPATITISNKPRGNETNVKKLRSKTLQALGLRHGDLVFIGYQPKAAHSVPTVEDDASAPSQDTSKRPWELVTEDRVDVYWRSQDGKIPRSRDPLFCKHSANGMCDHCMPLEPYDAAYHAEHSIKHLSYHAHLRKLDPKGTAPLPPLTPASYKVKVPCPTGNHPSWPAGICTACQPSAITLQSQPFRMVDHLEIASPDIIDRFLQAWRATGTQRFGWLIGHYEPYEEVPMGVKAVVEAIHEPPQEGELDGLSLGLPWEDESRIRELAGLATIPLTIVGYIFTDLVPNPDDLTKTVYKRHPNSFFLSSLEAVFAATLQAQHETPSRSSPTGKYGSRLVTAVLTATADGQVDIAAYQVSEQGVAMVDADMIEASVDPNTILVKEEDQAQGSARYVPDVFYTYKNEYGLQVKQTAKPSFPVEYLLVNVTHGFPQNPSPIFHSTKFQIENRPGLEDQRIEKVLSALSNLGATAESGVPSSKHVEIAKWISDWHLLAFLGTTELVSPSDMHVFIKAASSPALLEDSSQLQALFSTEGWQTLITFARENAPSNTSAPGGFSSTADDEIPQHILDEIAAQEAGSRGDSGASSANIKICQYCTFENPASHTDCEVCGLPLG